MHFDTSLVAAPRAVPLPTRRLVKEGLRKGPNPTHLSARGSPRDDDNKQ